MAFKRTVEEQDLPYEYILAGSIYQARNILENEDFDMVVCDFSLGDGTLFDILDEMVTKGIPIIVTTGAGDEETAVKAIKGGADDYLIKDVERNYLKMLGTTIDKAINNKNINLARQHMEASLRLSEEKFSKAFRCNPDPITISDLIGGYYVEVNDAFFEIFGYEPDEVIGHSVTELGIWLVPEERDEIIEEIKEQGSIRNREIKFRSKYGEIMTGLLSAEIIDVEGDPHLLCGSKDITEQKKADEEIKYLSFNDKLTGLYNRAFFEEELKRIDTQRQLPISLIMGDVNGLKLINDALGHHEGDKLLIKVAQILRKACRQEDIVARWGGDEFIILLPECDRAAATRVVEQIKSLCKHMDDLPIQISLSLGLAIKNCMAQDTKDVIKEAEDRMYRNKLLESRSTRSSFIISLEKTLRTRSHETKEHCHRMQKMAQKIGNAIELLDSELDKLKLLAMLHDIGKIAIPNSILDKPGKLTPEEWESIKKHPEIGYRIALCSPELAPIAEAILNHHERWDGTGYPLGLRGENIPLISRIIAIADTHDVMLNGRPYQKAVSQEVALGEIERCAGTQFDPKLAKIFLDLKD
ncbi:MAG: diguanylate cyclase [Firmicutes bacterium HGW-Firmicutes-15]|nr:MAG: diguanylate cyclase [Firmicutes bacterium HGW-Firmicutes-15]